MKLKRGLLWALALIVLVSVFSTTTVNAKSLKTQKPKISVSSKTMTQGYSKAFRVITIKKAKGKVSYSFTGKQKYFSINKKTGALTAKTSIPVGSYKVKVKIKIAKTKSYKAYSKTVTAKIIVKKRAQAPTITASTKTINQGYTEAFALISVKNAKGSRTYSFTNAQKYFSINKSTGALTAAAGVPTGSYSLGVKVYCAGNSIYKAYAKTVTVKVVVNPKDVGSRWTGKADITWYTGDKTSYDITTADQLAGLAQIVNTIGDENRFEGITINLMTDVVINDTTDWNMWTRSNPADKVWTPIGQEGDAVLGYRPFAGCFNGNGHTIRGLYVNGGNRCGLFAYTSSAIIENINFDKCVVYTSQEEEDGYAGVLAAECENSYFYNCKVSNARVDGTTSVGGLVGIGKKVNYTVEIAYTLFMGAGVVWNPVIAAAVESDQPVALSGVYFSNCSASNVALRCYKTWCAGNVGGIVGTMHESIIGKGVIASCHTTNVSALSVDLINYNSGIAVPLNVDTIVEAEKKGAGVKKGNCGAVYGSIASSVTVGDCSCSGFKRTDNSTTRSDASNVTGN